MFDPQYTRRSNRRYYTRKGQVNQAKAIDTPVVIEPRLIPIYLNYIKQNNLSEPEKVNVLDLTKQNGEDIPLTYTAIKVRQQIPKHQSMCVIEKLNNSAISLKLYVNDTLLSALIDVPDDSLFAIIPSLERDVILNMTDGTQINLSIGPVPDTQYFDTFTNIFNPNYAIDLTQYGST